MKLLPADLRLFAAIADHGGISAAARHLGVQKSTVSRELALLEERLGKRLVQRTTRRVSLTDTGELLAAHARRVMAEIDLAEMALEAISDEPEGLLRATASYAFVRYVLAPRMGEFLDRHPRLRLSIDPTVRVLDLVEEGIDVAIRIGELAASSLVARRLAVVPVILAASPGYVAARGAPSHIGDLTQHRLIDLRSRPTAHWDLLDAAGVPTKLALSAHIRLPDPGIVLDLVLAGAGIGLVPERYAVADFARGRLIHVLPGVTGGESPVQAVYPSRRLLAPKVRVFIDFVVECLAS